MAKVKTKAKLASDKSNQVPKKKYWVEIIYLIILTIVVVNLYNKVYDKKLFLGGDNAVYYITGKAIAEGKGYTNINLPGDPPAIWYPPGYPFISAGIMLVFGKNIEVMNKANGFFLFGSLILLYLISLRFTKNKHLSFIITLITALNMHILNYSFIAMTEIPFIFTSLASIYFLMRIKIQPLPFKDVNFWVFFFFLMLSYYIRPTGSVLIGGVVVYYLFARNWKMAAIVFFGFLLCAFPWYLRNKSVGGSRYDSQIVLKNPYQPELGAMQTKDWFARIEKNAKRYVSMEIPSALIGYNIPKYEKPAPHDINWPAGIIFVVLGIIGLFRVRELKWFIIAYFAGTVAILMLWPEVWTGTRLMLTIVPIIYILVILAIYDGISWIAKKINVQEKISVSVIPFLFLFFIFYQTDGIANLENMAKTGVMSPAYLRYFDVAKWAKTNIPPTSVVVCRKPELFYLYAGCKTTNYLFTLNSDSLIANMKTKKATHVVIEQLGFASTGRYLVPDLMANQEKFKLIYHVKDPDTYLYEIHYECGYTGEKKDGKKNGKGFSRFANGTSYDGSWKDDRKDGMGVFSWDNGYRFEGSFSNDLRNGPGVMYLNNGQKLVGIWVNDTINGHAILYDSLGRIKQQGIMKKNVFVNSK